MSHIMTHSSSAIAYTIYYVYVYINVCSRHSRPARIAPLPSRPFLADFAVGKRSDLTEYMTLSFTDGS